MLDLLLIFTSMFTEVEYVSEETKHTNDNSYFCAVAESRGADDYTLTINGCK